MPGKTPIWGNPMRERERSYYYALGKYISATNSQFPAKKKYLTTTNLSPQNSALKIMPKFLQLYGLLKNSA
jgi:hypothetical protein